LKVPLLGFSIQGLLPRYRDDLARSLSQVFRSELMSDDRLAELVSRPAVRREVAAGVSSVVRRRVESGLSLLPSFLRDRIAHGIARAVRSGVEAAWTEAVTSRKGVAATLDVGGAVESQLRDLSMDELEALVWRVARRELTWIVRIGGIVGFFVGLVHAALVLLLS